MDADVVVVGAGPVGSALTLLLRQRNVRTLLVDQAEFPRDKPCGEGLLPSGARVLSELGVDLAGLGCGPIDGVRYHAPGVGSAGAAFDGPAFGVRRLRLDALLAERAGAQTGVRVEGVRSVEGLRVMETTQGRLTARVVVGADGMRSVLRRSLGWERRAPASRRYGVVGHVAAPQHGRREIVVTLLGGLETYLTPVGPDELLVAVLGAGGRLRAPGRSVRDSYREIVARAHPDLADATLTGRVHGAGPFGTSARTVARDGVFLCGDAAGFLDPLTGEAMAAGLVQARTLATLLGRDPETAAARYRRWYAAQWRRRRAVSRLALTLTGTERLTRRALRGVERRPQAMARLLGVADGAHGFGRLGPRDWSALAGW
ncbi:MAG: NAD(P)/FAD-dependent oxidoreductase [bacterium]|nr:NAD(P)/FAD-dependent oxidoreductase [bacterium]